MMRLWFIAPIGLALVAGACGETKGQRAATGAGGGAIAGAAVGGPVGAVVGAGAGAATGAYRDRVDDVVDEQAENVSDKINDRSASQSSRSGQQASMSEGRQLSNDEVREAQTALRDMGLYNGEIDGLYGPQTINAVGEYQAQQNLPRTMALDDQTIQHLQQADAGSAPPTDRQIGERPAEESGSPAPMGEPAPATP